MIHRNYLIAVLAASFMSWISFAVVLYQLSPFSQVYLSLSLFYASLFVALSGTFSMVFYGLRRWANKTEIHNVHLNASIRQGVLVSVMLVVGLSFQRLRILTWWDGLLLLAIVLMIEFWFMNRDRS